MPGVERVQLSASGLREYLRTEPALPAVLAPPAAAVEQRFRAYAAQHVESGEYEGSVRRELYRNRGRQTIRVIADDDKAAILEAEFRVMGRAAG